MPSPLIPSFAPPAQPGDPVFLECGGVPCTIFAPDGVVESWPPEGPRAQLTLRCPYQDRYLVIQALRGYVTLAGSTMQATLPLQYPPSPNLRVFTIGDVTGQRPFRDRTGWLSYKWALIPVTFQTLTWDAPQYESQNPLPPFSELRGSAAPEVFSPPGGAFYFPDLKGAPVAEGTLGMIRPHCEFTLTRKQLPYPPIDAIMFLEGTVNDEPVQIYNRTFPRGCLMFTGADFEPEADPATGLTTYSVAFKFLGNDSAEFNMAMGPDGNFHLLNDAKDGSGLPPFDYTDFSWFWGDDLEYAEPEIPGLVDQ